MRIKYINLAKVALFLYFVLSPLYIFPRGLPQIADWIIVFLFSPWLCVSISRLPKITAPILIPFTFFVIWTSIINFIHAVLLQDTWMLIFSAFYAFNLFFLVGVGTLVGNCSLRYFFRWMKWLTLVASLSALSLYFLMDAGLERGTGSFNNPNQMAYFALLIICLSAIASWADGKWDLVVLITVISCSILILLAYSLTAVVSLLLVFSGIILIITLSKRVKIHIKYFLVIVLFICYCLIPVILLSDNPMISNVVVNWNARAEKVKTKSDNIVTERGYDRILNHPEYLVFGAGEGGLKRFTLDYTTTVEIHSSLGTILFSYGIIGLTLFGVLLISSLQGAPLSIWIIMMAPIVFGITHQGIRQPLFWLCIMMVRLAVVKKEKDKNALKFWLPVSPNKSIT